MVYSNDKNEIIYCPTTIHHKGIRLDAQKTAFRESFNFRLYFGVFAVNLLSFATGNAYAWSSSVLILLKKNDPNENPLGRAITSSEESLIASLLSLGASMGPFFAGYCSDKFGRKRTLLIFSVPMLISHLIVAFASNAIEYYIARFMMGLGAGCVFTVIPIYVGEIAETKIRGLLGSVMAVLLSNGLLLVYTIGSYVNIMTLSFILMIPVGLFMIFFGFFVPESPYYFVANGRKSSAIISLSRLRTTDESSILQELKEIEDVINEAKAKYSVKELFSSRSFIKGITITTTLMYFQQFIGITILLSYLESIFTATGSSISPSSSTLIVAVVQSMSVLVSCLLVDRWGRRMLLLIASLGCASPLMVLATFFYMKNSEMDVSSLWWLPIACLMFFFITFNFGMGSLPWTLVGELFSAKTKALASSVTAFTCLFLAFLLTLIFPSLEQFIGFHGAFGLFAANAVLCFFFVFWYVPETKGKTFQEISKILEE